MDNTGEVIIFGVIFGHIFTYFLCEHVNKNSDNYSFIIVIYLWYSNILSTSEEYVGISYSACPKKHKFYNILHEIIHFDSRIL